MIDSRIMTVHREIRSCIILLVHNKVVFFQKRTLVRNIVAKNRQEISVLGAALR